MHKVRIISAASNSSWVHLKRQRKNWITTQHTFFSLQRNKCFLLWFLWHLMFVRIHISSDFMWSFLCCCIVSYMRSHSSIECAKALTFSPHFVCFGVFVVVVVHFDFFVALIRYSFFFSVRSSTVSYCLLCLHGQVASKCSQARSSSCSHFPFQFSFTFSFSVDAVWCLYVFAFGEVSSFRSYYVPCFRHFLSVFFFSRINAVFACLITVFYLLPVWYKWSHINFNDMNCGFFLALWIQMHLHHSSNSFLYGSFVGFFFVPFSPSTCAQMIKRFTIAHCDALCFLGARIIIIYGRPNEQKKTPPFFFSLAILLREW